MCKRLSRRNITEQVLNELLPGKPPHNALVVITESRSLIQLDYKRSTSHINNLKAYMGIF